MLTTQAQAILNNEAMRRLTEDELNAVGGGRFLAADPQTALIMNTALALAKIDGIYGTNFLGGFLS